MSKYDKKVLLSAFQKYIRRCDPMTLYWAKELYLMDPNLVWQKLEVIGSEDIGIACPNIQTYIFNQKQLHDSKNDIPFRRFVLLNTINYLINQNKSRICDNVNHAYFKNNLPIINEEKNQLLNCFTLSLDGQVKLGALIPSFTKSINERDLDSSLKYAAHLFKMENERYLINVLREPRNEHTTVLINLFNKYNSLNRNRTDVLFLVHLILYRTMDLNSINIVEVNDLTMDHVNKIFKDDAPLEFDDYVFDKHTNQGVKMGRGFKHFYEEGAVLKQCFIPDPYEKIARANNNAN